MTEILKICKKHGELDSKNAIPRPMKNKMSYKCRICKNESNRRERINFPERRIIEYKKYNESGKLKENNLKRYGITTAQYNEMLSKQNNLCAICFEKEIYISHTTKKIKDLSVDHCHITGKVRKLLCHKCNRGMGLFNDSIEKLESAIRYLKENG